MISVSKSDKILTEIIDMLKGATNLYKDDFSPECYNQLQLFKMHLRDTWLFKGLQVEKRDINVKKLFSLLKKIDLEDTWLTSEENWKEIKKTYDKLISSTTPC